jgi:chromosome segregation ATPase
MGIFVRLQRELQAARQELDQTKQDLDEARRRIAELERRLGGSSAAKVLEPFSVKAEEKRQAARAKKRRKRRGKGGRRTTAQKVALAERTEKVFPAGVPAADCWLSHTRPVWRLENGKGVLVA